MKRILLTLALVAAAGTTGAQTTANLPPVPNAPGSAKAEAQIKADGYTNVQGLQRNSNGTWSGKAMRGNTQVDLSVDARGSVTTK